MACEFVQVFLSGWRRRPAKLHGDGASLGDAGLGPKVLWQTEVHRPWHFCRGHLHGATQRLAEIGRLEAGGPLGQWAKQRLVIDVHLQRPVAHAFWRFGGQRQHWRAVQQGRANTRAEIRGPRTIRPIAGPRSSGEHPTDGRHKSCCRFGTRQYVLHWPRTHGLHVGRPGPTGYAKYVLHPGFGQQLDHGCRDVCHACSLDGRWPIAHVSHYIHQPQGQAQPLFALSDLLGSKRRIACPCYCSICS